MFGLIATAVSIWVLLDLLFALRIRRSILFLAAFACLISLPLQVDAQLLTEPEPAAISAVGTISSPAYPIYTRPTQSTRNINYLLDTVGPYPVVTAAVSAAIDQETNKPPEWKQGFKGYSKRFGSDFGIATVSTTTRYALSGAFKEDSLYYRCECTGVFPRFAHALFSTFTARAGDDGRRVFSIPAVVAPYAGSFTGVYAWYPNRYGAKDAFRIGNYNLLEYMGGNVALEFFYRAPRSLISRMHLNNRHGAPDQDMRR